MVSLKDVPADQLCNLTGLQVPRHASVQGKVPEGIIHVYLHQYFVFLCSKINLTVNDSFLIGLVFAEKEQKQCCHLVILQAYIMIKHKNGKNNQKHPGLCCSIYKYFHLYIVLLCRCVFSLCKKGQVNYLCFFGLLLWVMGVSGGAGDGSFFALVLPPYLPAGSGSVFDGDVRLWDRGDPTIVLFTGEVLWAEGQSCWLRHTEHRGLTGRQTCCPKPTSSQLISLHSPLEQREKAPLKPTSSCVLAHLGAALKQCHWLPWLPGEPLLQRFPCFLGSLCWFREPAKSVGDAMNMSVHAWMRKKKKMLTCWYATAVFL